MISVTERAKVLLLELKSNANIRDPGIGLRIAREALDRWILVADHPRSGDQVIEHAGVTVLLIGPDVQRTLDGTTVDCMETPDGLDLAVTAAAAQNGHYGT
jgi:Fe-S cluster assembly iron-binding protein IscA